MSLGFFFLLVCIFLDVVWTVDSVSSQGEILDGIFYLLLERRPYILFRLIMELLLLAGHDVSTILTNSQR